MKAIVLFSGGLDSTTCLAMAVKEYGADNVEAVSIRYGQKHKREIESARRIAEYYGVNLSEYDASAIFKDSGSTLFVGDIPEKSYDEQLKESNGNPVSTYVPFRNGLFLSIAVCVAMIKGCDEVICGIHADDAAGNAYPDCSSAFYTLMNGAAYEGSGHKIRILAPFVNKTKADIVAEGLRLNVPYEMTWSCYQGGDKPCGKCGTCIDRAKAFEKNGAKDPLL